MRARPRHIAAAVGAAALLVAAGLFLGHAVLTAPGKPVVVTVETKPTSDPGLLSGRSITPTRFVTDGAPLPVIKVTSVPSARRLICKRHKKREARS